jgi:long-chain acyl-CoA synthetase
LDDALIAAISNGTTIAHWAQHAPDRPAIVPADGDPAQHRTFAELSARANQLSRALRARGLRAGDGVALMCHNAAEFAEVWAAAWQAGLRLTAINWHLGGDEAGYIVDDCEAKAFIAASRFAAAAGPAAAASPHARVRLAIGGGAGGVDGFDPYDDALAAEDAAPLDDPVLGSMMLYTSGTTGRSKGVHRPSVPELVARGIAAYGYREGNVHLCTGPMYHTAPLTISMSIPLQAGVPLVVMDRWDAEDTLRLVDAHRVTHTHMVATMFHRLLALPEHVRAKYDVSSLLAVVHGAAPCPVDVKARMIEWFGPVLVEYYAATEGAGTIVFSDVWLTKPGTVGKPNPPEQVKVGDERCEPLPAGEVGMVWLRAPANDRFRYFKDDAKTESAYRGDYFTLGDMGYLDEDGFLFLTDRSANLIISGGVNIYPAEVDAVLLTHPAVGDVATIGIPHDDWGEEVRAVVQPADGVEPTGELAADLVAWCRDRLAHFKCPRQVDFVAELPREESGKIFKHRLRAEYRARAAAGGPASG